MTIEKYKTVFGQSFDDLDQAVKVELEQGWQPYGSPYARQGRDAKYGGESWVCQAMIKEPIAYLNP